MSERITEAGLVEVETMLRRAVAEDGPLEPARVSAKLALQFVDEVRRLRGLIVDTLDEQGLSRMTTQAENEDSFCCSVDTGGRCETHALLAEARAIREEQRRG
jgi:hypothetical protein